MSIELRHLRYFVAVAEELNFRRAAERLHMSQPPLSQQIRALERAMGVTLLQRDKRRVELTPAGRAFLDHSRDILAVVQRAVDAAQRRQRGEIGTLAVGFVGSAMYGRVPELLRAFRQQRPGVEARLRELTTGAQVTALRAREIDVGFLRPPVDAEGISVEIFEREPLVVALPRAHPLASSADRPLAVARLREQALVMLPAAEAPGLYAATMGTLARAGVAPRVVQTVSELQTAIALVAAGLGVSLVPASFRALRRPDVVYRPLRGAPAAVELAVAHRRGEESPLVRALIELARSPQARR